MNDGGATPKKDPTQNGNRGTPITGETMLINQLGRKGVIRRNSMYDRRLDLKHLIILCLSTNSINKTPVCENQPHSNKLTLPVIVNFF